MRIMHRPIFAASALLLLAGNGAAATQTAFVSCPIVRDTASVPCWLSEYKGELYYLGIQTDVSSEFHPPSLGHKVLVEGTVSNEPRICGGIVLKPVTISIMPELTPGCNTMLMAEDRYKLPFEAPRPPGPSTGKLAFTYAPPPPLPSPPYQPKEFGITYDFDGMVGFSHPRMLTPIMAYAEHVGAKKITVTGYRGATRLEDGTVLAEDEDIGRKRAEQVAKLLEGAGLTAPTYVTEWKTRAETGDASRRRVRVVVTP
jgi:hypothetical protein